MYTDAKIAFEKAISMDKSNKSAYIDIHKKYLEKQRLDDAYYFIKLATINHIDTDNMNKLLTEIESKFEVIKIDYFVKPHRLDTLPNKISTKISDDIQLADVTWNNDTVDTSKLGTSVYEGKLVAYGRKVELSLIVKEPEPNKITGFVKKIYDHNGKWYMDFEEVDFYRNYTKSSNDKTATLEANVYGEHLVDSDYYYRNKNNGIKTLEINSDEKINICIHRLGKNGPLSSVVEEISLDKFNTLNVNMGRFMCHLNVENNVITRIEEQFIP
jgi:hypothetical protein